MLFRSWHLHYSRATFEVTVALFLFMLGAILMIISFEGKRRWLFLMGTFCFILAIYTYNLTRLLSPLLFLALIWTHREKIRNIQKNELFLTAFISLVLLFPFFATLRSSAGALSAKGTFILTSAAVQAPLLEFRSYFISLPSISKIMSPGLKSAFMAA